MINNKDRSWKVRKDQYYLGINDIAELHEDIMRLNREHSYAATEL